jgi:hypothetical protein
MQNIEKSIKPNKILLKVDQFTNLNNKFLADLTEG